MKIDDFKEAMGTVRDFMENGVMEPMKALHDQIESEPLDVEESKQSEQEASEANCQNLIVISQDNKLNLID